MTRPWTDLVEDRVTIVGVGHYLPDKTVSSEWIEAQVNSINGSKPLTRGLIRLLSGVAERRFAEHREPSSLLAARAAARALNSAAIAADDVNLLIFAAASHDISEPATANIVQSLTGCSGASVFDVKNACNSFLNGIDVARSLLLTKQYDIALVATGEVLHPVIDWRIRDRSELGRKFAALTLGDGGGACVLKRDRSTSSESIIFPAHFHSDGSHWETSTILAGGTLYTDDFSRRYFECDSAALHGLAITRLPKLIRQTLENLEWQLSDIDLVIPHQVSVPLVARLCQELDFPISKCQITVDRFGNMAAASIPVAMSVAVEEGRLRRGDRIFLIGGAAGFSAAVLPLIF